MAGVSPEPIADPIARAVIQSAADAIVAVDENSQVTVWNPAAERLFGWPAEQVIGRPLPEPALGRALDSAARTDEPSDPSNPAELADPSGHAANAPARQLRCRRSDGRMLTIEASTSPTRDDEGRVCGVMALLVDVTERERLQRQLQHQAHHDALTGLPNRELLTERLGEALVAAGPKGTQTGLLLFDLDRFKEINDTLGHGCGDQVLAQIGPRLITSAIRGHDTVARLAGDEFAVLLPDLVDARGAVAVAERVLAALQAPFSVGADSDPTGPAAIHVEASIGVAVAPGHGDDATALLRHADTARYDAKEAASGIAVYQGGDGAGAPNRFELLGELRRALAGDELIVHYQPKIDVETGALHGVEALARWQHPTRGLVPPGEFIPVAETTGLIHPLTDRVLDLALAQTREWSDAGLTVPVAVNLSARCLHDSELPLRVLTALQRHRVPASQLCLEITESAIMRDPAGALVILRDLADAGISLSLDDFGTGYSSMTYLRHLPVAELKVDQSFVVDLIAKRADTVLVRSAVDLGHNLGLSVVAEGVEDAPTLDVLRELGCDVAQGYYIARPMPARDLETWLSAAHPCGRAVPATAASRLVGAQQA